MDKPKGTYQIKKLLEKSDGFCYASLVKLTGNGPAELGLRCFGGEEFAGGIGGKMEIVLQDNGTVPDSVYDLNENFPVDTFGYRNRIYLP